MKEVSTIAILLSTLGLAGTLAPIPADAQDKVSVERITLPGPGAVRTVKGRVRGYDSDEFVFRAEGRRPVTISFRPDNRSCYFNLMQRGSEDHIFTGSVEGNVFNGRLEPGRNYRIQTYLMRNAARRNAVCSYTLTMR